MDTRGSTGGTPCPYKRGGPLVIPLFPAPGAAAVLPPPPPFQTLRFIGLILARSTCIGSAAVPLLSKGGNSAVFGPSVPVTWWWTEEASDTEGFAMIGEGWYGTLLAAQSGR